MAKKEKLLSEHVAEALGRGVAADALGEALDKLPGAPKPPKEEEAESSKSKAKA